MSTYDLNHLNQLDNQEVLGPIQDDEALLLFSLIRCLRISVIVEIGGLGGYSAKNFLEAIKLSKDPVVYSVDISVTPTMGNNHKVIIKPAAAVTKNDIDNKHIDLLFFDCHDYNQQLMVYNTLKDSGNITDGTMLVLHDTNLHPNKVTGTSIKIDAGWVHQSAERALVNDFKDLGYDCINIHTNMSVHDQFLPFRHGLTICTKFRKF